MKKIIPILTLSLLMMGCYRTIQVPPDPAMCPPVMTLQQPKLPWPDEPTRRLEELTAGTIGPTKLAIVLEANKRTIVNLEETLKRTGRVQDPPKGE